MSLLFTRKSFLANDQEFQGMNFMKSPKSYGIFEIHEWGISFMDTNGNNVEVPIRKVDIIEVVNEHPKGWYKWITLIVPLLAIVQLVRSWGSVTPIDFLFVLVICGVFGYLEYIALYKRKWLHITSSDNSFSGYVSFDWRADYLRLPWNRQESGLSWFANAGDCSEAARILQKIKEIN
jgi:hypothetical protein